MMKKMTVAVAMSGGVDSSTAAAILKEKGHAVFGLTMKLFSPPGFHCQEDHTRNCCGMESILAAAAVAGRLKIPHHVIDLKGDFERLVVEDFCREYERGRTPNPCIRCNQWIKFDILWKRAVQLGADYLATGHYARIESDPSDGRFFLKKGRDQTKDQSYFLYPLNQIQLSRTMFPVGDYSKDKIRSLASDFGLPSAYRPESQEICFVPDRNYAKYLKERIPHAFRPGKILNRSGEILGRHQGIIHFTIGQRRGLGISHARPLYVVEIRAKQRIVVAGYEEDLYSSRLEAEALSWVPLILPRKGEPVQARIRYKHRESPASLVPLGGERIGVEFESPQRAVTPGQSVVFYREDVVLGGGIIRSPFGPVSSPAGLK